MSSVGFDDLSKLHKQRIKERKARIFRRRMIILGVIVLIVASFGTIYYFGQRPSSEPDKVLLRTTMGDITIQLYDDIPVTTGNFKDLVKRGVYDGTIFHRVIADFMIQGGDPTGTGYGDPNIPAIPDEFTDNNRNDRGTVAMANAGPNTGSSQFFINLVNNNHLDSKHPVFGKVIAGMDIVDAIGKVSTNENDKPLQDVRIIKAELIK